MLDPIRTAFAKANGVKPTLFSANSEVDCPTCNAPTSSPARSTFTGEHLAAYVGL